MAGYERRVLKQLARAKIDYESLEQRQRAAYALTDEPLPQLDYEKDLQRKFENYTIVPQLRPDVHIFDRYFKNVAALVVSRWEEAGRSGYDQKVRALQGVRRDAVGLLSRLDRITSPSRTTWRRASEAVRKADMAITREALPLPTEDDDPEASSWTVPPAGGRLPVRPAAAAVVVLWVLLAAAATMDVVTFRQVIDLVSNLLPDWAAWTVSVAFAGMALSFAHFAGRFMSDRHQIFRRNVFTSWLADVLILGWLLLGSVAFSIRLTGKLESGTTVIIEGQPVVSAPTAPPGHELLAVLFLALYVASGLIAFVAAYFGHNPFRTAKAQGEQTHRQLSALMPVAEELCARARAIFDDVDAHLRDIEHRWADTRAERVEIVASVPISAAHVALRSTYGLDAEVPDDEE